MRASLNQFAARSVFAIGLLFVLPSLSWLGLYGTARLFGSPLRSIATGIAMALCAVSGIGHLRNLLATADLFDGASVWKHLIAMLIQLAPFYCVSIAVGVALTWCWPYMFRVARSVLPESWPSESLGECTAHGVVGLVVSLVTPLPVWIAFWIVTHHNFRRFDLRIGNQA
ncbi:MAG: hypothetical protein IPK83_21250 [Planctomycetes bacterium]|nr:hypothetical protein [Planctomycetota bacterium]